MRKRKPQQILNHYSAWKYVVLVVTVAIMLLSAIPTWFGEDAAVQIRQLRKLSKNQLIPL